MVDGFILGVSVFQFMVAGFFMLMIKDLDDGLGSAFWMAFLFMIINVGLAIWNMSIAFR